MSELTTAARPYARAAFDYASSNGVIGQWAEMLGFCAAVANDATMKTALDQPSLNRQQSAELFNEVCADKLDGHAKNFIKLLAENDRISLLPDIVVLYHHYQAQAQGTVDAELISALEVDDQQVEAISASLAKRLGKKVSITTSIDETLIGGAIIRAGDMVIDGSVRGRLEKLSNTLSN
ncbi:MAG: F0F1 ATP synthase subunit delta [Gammaproteobacteria bacterium]|nr:F0F1 ATP synthase subunit delta [Gammaproteobacteria bacterium]